MLWSKNMVPSKLTCHHVPYLDGRLGVYSGKPHFQTYPYGKTKDGKTLPGKIVSIQVQHP